MSTEGTGKDRSSDQRQAQRLTLVELMELICFKKNKSTKGRRSTQNMGKGNLRKGYNDTVVVNHLLSSYHVLSSLYKSFNPYNTIMGIRRL